MNAIKILKQAEDELEAGKINLGEYEKLIQPLENVELIVRCKDCIHYRYYGLDEYPVSECKIDHQENPDEDWFCADGKKEDELCSAKNASA